MPFYFFSLAFWLISTLFLAWFSRPSLAVNWLIDGCFYIAVIAFIFSITYRLIRWKVDYNIAFIRATNWVTSIVIIVLCIVVSFLTYYGYQTPALATITLSNGVKTITFQSMAHIWPQHWYDTIAEDITAASNRWALIAYEGIRTKSGSQSDISVLSSLVGIVVREDLYPELALLGGYRAQDNEALLQWVRPPERAINVDLSVSDLVASLSWGVLQKWSEVPDIVPSIQRLRATLHPREQALVHLIYRAGLNYILRQNTSIHTSLSPTFQSVLLDRRDEHIARFLHESQEKDIYALYGGLHFNGVFMQLQKRDPQWRITKVTSIK